MFTYFTRVYLLLHLFTYVYPCLLVITYVYHCLLVFNTSLVLFLPLLTQV